MQKSKIKHARYYPQQGGAKKHSSWSKRTNIEKKKLNIRTKSLNIFKSENKYQNGHKKRTDEVKNFHGFILNSK